MSRARVAFGSVVPLILVACGSSFSDTEAVDATGAAAARAGAPVLRRGEVAELSVADGLAAGTFVTGGPDERYVVVIASTKFDGSSGEHAWSVDSAAALDPAHARATIADGCALSPDAWSAVVPPSETAPEGAAVAVGARKTVHASTKSGVEDIQVEAIAVGSRAVVWADVTASHPAKLDAAFVAQFLTDFEQTILPRERSVFGVESDADHDGHIGLVFTPLTHQTAVAFFSSCDLESAAECPSTNSGDYLWLTPPSAIDPPYNTPNAIKEILSHELAHLIHYNRKVVRNRLPSWTDSGYMDEGIGALAQDVIGPQAGNLYVTMAGLEEISDFSLSDTLVDGTAYDTKHDGALRGGSYLFVRWLYDRAGGDVALAGGAIEGRGGPALLRSLLDSRDSVAKTLPRALARPIADIGTDFYTALAMSNRDEVGGARPTNPCFGYQPTQVDPVTGKQRGANLYARFHGMQMNGVATTDATSGTVRTGGASYVAVPAPTSGGPLSLTVRVDPASLPRVRVGRVL